MTFKENIRNIKALIMARSIHGISDLMNDGRAFTLTKIMDIVIAIIFVAVLLPVGFTMWGESGNTMFANTTLGDSLRTVWNIAPVLVTLAIVIGLVYMALGSRGK